MPDLGAVLGAGDVLATPAVGPPTVRVTSVAHTDRSSEPVGRVDVVTLMSEAVERVNMLLTRYRDIAAIVPMVPLTRAYMTSFLDLGVPAANRGSRVRTLYCDSIHRHQVSIDFVRRTVRAGAQARCVSVPPCTLPGPVVVGNRVAIFASMACHERQWMFVDGGAPVETAVAIFERAWATSSDIDQGEPDDTLDPLERRILVQLSRGVKDETAARALGVSARTYRRHVTALCEMLGANSRFEAGAKAAHIGWI